MQLQIKRNTNTEHIIPNTLNSKLNANDTQSSMEISYLTYAYKGITRKYRNIYVGLEGQKWNDK